MPGTKKNPPKLAEWLLSKLTVYGDNFRLLSDFEGEFNAIQDQESRRKACIWYWLQTVHAIKTYLLLSIFWSVAMFKNYVKIAYRNIRKNKIYSFINIAGLSISMAGFIYVLSGFLILSSVYSFSENPKFYLKPILAVCAINLIMALCQYFGHDLVWLRTPGITGFMSTKNQLGQYSALSFPVLFYINPFLSIVPLTTLILSKGISNSQ